MKPLLWFAAILGFSTPLLAQTPVPAQYDSQVWANLSSKTVLLRTSEDPQAWVGFVISETGIILVQTGKGRRQEGYLGDPGAAARLGGAPGGPIQEPVGTLNQEPENEMTAQLLNGSRRYPVEKIESPYLSHMGWSYYRLKELPPSGTPLKPIEFQGIGPAEDTLFFLDVVPGPDEESKHELLVIQRPLIASYSASADALLSRTRVVEAGGSDLLGSIGFNREGKAVGAVNPNCSRKGYCKLLPADQFKDVASEVEEGLKHFPKLRFGIVTLPLPPQLRDHLSKECGTALPPDPLYLSAVDLNSPAERAGLRPGDILVSVFGRALSKSSQDELLKPLLDAANEGDSIDVEVLRRGAQGWERLTLDLRLVQARKIDTWWDKQNKIFFSDLSDNERLALQFSGHPTSGVKVERITEASLLGVKAGGISELFGLAGGDIILELNDAPIPDLRRFKELWEKLPPKGEKERRLLVLRDGERLYLSLNGSHGF